MLLTGSNAGGLSSLHWVAIKRMIQVAGVIWPPEAAVADSLTLRLGSLLNCTASHRVVAARMTVVVVEARGPIKQQPIIFRAAVDQVNIADHEEHLPL